MSNDKTLSFKNEDHTVGSLLREELLKNPKVEFAAYKVPHPLFKTVEVRVISREPIEKIVNEALDSLIDQIEELLEQI